MWEAHQGGRSIIDQLKESGVEMGWDNYIVPYGRDTISAIYPLNWAIRSAMTFGGLKAGQGKKCLLYTKERVFAFGLTLGLVDDLKYATGAGAINMGFPIIADTDIPEIKPSGITTYEALVKEFDYKKIVPRCIEVRGSGLRFPKFPYRFSMARPLKERGSGGNSFTASSAGSPLRPLSLFRCGILLR